VIVRREARRDVLLAPRIALDLGGRTPRARLADDRFSEVKLGSCNVHDCIVLGGLNDGDLLAAVVPTEAGRE